MSKLKPMIIVLIISGLIVLIAGIIMVQTGFATFEDNEPRVGLYIGGIFTIIGGVFLIFGGIIYLNFDGLMIETHPNPDKAWSDAAQQLTPSNLVILLNDLVLRSEEYSSDVANVINDIRDKVATLDDRIFDILSERI